MSNPLSSDVQSQPEQVAAQTPQQRPLTAPWSLTRRVVFRFVCCYLLLYMAPARPDGRVNLVEVIPGGSWLANGYCGLWHKGGSWGGIHIFHLNGKATTYFPTGSGDTTLDFIEDLLFVVFAAVGAAVWSVADQQRTEYRRLHSWLRVLVRYTLAFTMLAYGFDKVFPLQFRFPGFGVLTQVYSDFSPMGVLWNFMGTSMAYTIFSGICEVVAGTLLLFRRTTMLGAVMSLGVLLNVAMLNFCYDVPVKLYSTNLLLMTIFLAAPDLRRLLNFFVLNQVVKTADMSEPRVA